MSAGTVPILMCDHEDGCDVWAVDYYAMGASVPKLPDGWRPLDDCFVLCPQHLMPALSTQWGCEVVRKCKEGEDDGWTVHRCWLNAGHDGDHRSLEGYVWPLSTSGEMKS